MKIKRSDAHDRIIQFKKQGDYISEGCIDCIKNRPEEFGNLPFYIFAHKREIALDERTSIYNQDLIQSLQNPLQMRKYWKVEDVPSHRQIWMPRLVKPTAQTNSMLFKAYPPTDKIKIIWMIPDRSMWGQYKEGNMTESEDVSRSIHLFQNDRKTLEVREEEDLSDNEVNRIYTEISKNLNNRIGRKNVKI